jgi:hypothetical protein
MAQASISVITVTHNHAQYIERCLAALVPEVDRICGEVIVVDNAPMMKARRSLTGSLGFNPRSPRL